MIGPFIDEHEELIVTIKLENLTAVEGDSAKKNHVRVKVTMEQGNDPANLSSFSVRDTWGQWRSES